MSLSNGIPMGLFVIFSFWKIIYKCHYLRKWPKHHEWLCRALKVAKPPQGIVSVFAILKYYLRNLFPENVM